MTIHIRNPIRRHGDNPSGNYAMIPNELARNPTLSNYAYRLAIEIRTHAENFEVSAAGIANAHGWSRGTVKQALDELVAARWLAVRRYVNGAGNRIFDEYHFNVARPFTEEESTELNSSVTLRPRHDSPEVTPLSSWEAGECAESEHPPALGQGIKEDHQEHQLEEQEEHQPSACWICGGCGFDGLHPCEMVVHLRWSNFQAAKESSTTNESICFSCDTVGRDRCLIHTPSAVGRLQLSQGH